MYIMKLVPVVKDYIWGGTRLRDEYGIESPYERTAEAWMLSCHPDGRVKVGNGEHEGKSLPKVLTMHPEYMGTHARNFSMFPVMIKLIDAHDNLSLQVHPDDEYALAVDNDQGKHELWYIIDCDEDSEIIYGFREELTQEEFKRAIEDGTILDSVEHFKPKKGDVFNIEAGTIHAIGKGILLAEVQQNSNATYRVYDYDRTDAEGNRRQLHISKAIDVTITTPPTIPPGAMSPPEDVEAHTQTLLGTCEYFNTTLVETYMPTHIQVDDDSFACVLMVEGSAKFYAGDNDIELNKGECAFIPAGTGKVTVNGQSKFILTKI